MRPCDKIRFAAFACSPHFAAAHKRLPHPVCQAARTLRCWSTHPPVLRQALVFPDVSRVAFCLDLTTFPKIQFFKKQS
jgi:hypothetical protein